MEDVLVMVNPQKDFFYGSLQREEGHKIISKMSNFLMEWGGGKIYLIKDLHFSNYLDTLEGKQIPIIHCQQESEGEELCDEIKAAISGRDPETVVECVKTGFGCFSIIPLLGNSENDYDHIHICGAFTDIGVLTNSLLLRSSLKEKHIFCHSNLCLGTTPSNHEHAIACMKSCGVEIFGE